MKPRLLFVLGAGASAGFNIPLANALVNLTAGAYVELNQKIPYGAMGHNDPLDQDLNARWHKSIADKIRLSRAPTIDTFLKHATDRDAITAAMADVIWKHEDEALDRGFGYSRADGTLLDDDWIAWLLHNRLLDDLSQFPGNNFAFVSFNYDRMPQASMATMLSSLSRGMLAEHWLKKIDDEIEDSDGLQRFYHAHGRLGAPLRHADSQDRLRSYYRKFISPKELAEDILTIHDGSEAHDAKSTIARYINWASHVVFLGVGFHTELLDYFRKSDELGWIKRKAFVGATAYKLDSAARRRAATWANAGVVLGTDQQTCTGFLADHLV